VENKSSLKTNHPGADGGSHAEDRVETAIMHGAGGRDDGGRCDGFKEEAVQGAGAGDSGH
jgi:hypothetical protein